MELISKNKLIKSIELGIKQLEESEKNIVPNELGSPDIVIPCAIMIMKSMIEVVNMCDVVESRPTGKWIKESDYKVMGDGYLWNCSECGERVFVDSNGEFPNFCERCGADMRGKG